MAFEILSPYTLISASLWLIFIFVFVGAIRDALFSPLSHLPGSPLRRFSRLPYFIDTITGRMAVSLRNQHDKYGSIVRTAPNEISFTQTSAWKTIYGSRQGAYARYKKNYDQFGQEHSNLAQSLFINTDENHLRMRKVLLHAFSDQSLREQESLIQGHVKTLINELDKATASSATAIDLVQWYNWIAFDIVADLSFGEPFDVLTSATHRSWVEILSQAWKLFSLISAFRGIAPSVSMFRFLIPSRFVTKYVDHFDVILDRVSKRLLRGHKRPDFLSSMVQHNKGALSDQELISNATLIIAAGTETVATLLPALTYLLCVYPTSMEKATREVRKRFSKEEEILLQDSKDLVYLTACINEALRLFPPVPEGLPRIVPDGGDSICDKWIPGGTYVQVSPYAANLSAANFSCPDEFVPERWLSTSEPFIQDKRGAFQPFSVGPRNCLGQSLAMSEIRLIMANVLRSFDMQLDPSMNRSWTDQKSYILWVKKPLKVNLKKACD